ncbi:MAG: prepilin peptidase [Alphaproteobacteria bacterium]|nr:prepilin peptidase [Alphaproteobacteria bacterium]
MVSASTFIHMAVLLTAAILLIAAAISDVRSYRIPNYLCAALMLLFPFYVMTAPNPVDWRRNAVVFGIVFAVGFAAYLGNVMGAGDIKLLSATSLWAGPHFIAFLLIITAFTGGIQSLAALVSSKLPSSKKHRFFHLKTSNKKQIPYGVAIASGGLAVLGLIAHPLLLLDP